MLLVASKEEKKKEMSELYEIMNPHRANDAVPAVFANWNSLPARRSAAISVTLRRNTTISALPSLSRALDLLFSEKVKTKIIPKAQHVNLNEVER
jgi:hypothetical protein